MKEESPKTWSPREIVKKTVRAISAMIIVAGTVGLIASCVEQNSKLQEVNSSEFHTDTPKEIGAASVMAFGILLFAANEQDWGGNPKDKPSNQ